MNGAYSRCRVHGHYAYAYNHGRCPLCRNEKNHPERLTDKERTRQFNAYGGVRNAHA